MDERDCSFLMMLLREEDHRAQGRLHRCRLFSDSFLLRQKVPNLSCKDVLKPRLLKKLWSLLVVIALISIKYPICGCERKILISGDFLAG